MLQHLSVTNYALIDRVEVTFGRGLTAITGETGSGKSILLGAFGLLLGERADTRSIRQPDNKCIVEAEFDLKGFDLTAFFSSNDLDYEERTTIRREIAPGGKSRAFINDTPVSLATLRALGERLVDIHSQHENSILGDKEFQFSVVDAFGGDKELLDHYRNHFQDYSRIRRELQEAREREQRLRQDVDYFRFQWGELDQAGLDDLDQQGLEQELDMLTHAESIRAVIEQLNGLLHGESTGLISMINAVRQQIQRISSFHSELTQLADRVESSRIEWNDLSSELEAFGERVEIDPARAEALRERLDLLYRLQQKHHVTSVADLQALREQFAANIEGYEGMEETILQLEKDLATCQNDLTVLSDRLTAVRRKGAEKARTFVLDYFRELSLEHADLSIILTPSTDFTPLGRDEIDFLFRANKGSSLQPIRMVASGGEISRVMLALKASISRYSKLPVLILDEIDQGVSGEVARRMGSILREMSRDMQLITITHLPQIAGKAEHHFKVSKHHGESSTTTQVHELSHEERVHELAEMLSGKELTRAAIENARELLN